MRGDGPRGPAADAYEVGYGKPPVATRFKKGQSGNPKGRPKQTAQFEEFVERHLDEQVAFLLDGRPVSLTKREITVVQLISKGLQGNVAALRMVFKRMRAIYPRAEPPPWRIVPPKGAKGSPRG